MNNPSPEAAQAVKFMGYVKKGKSCWFWTGGRSSGYGRYYMGKRTFYAHRYSYMLFVGPIPKNLQLDHLCRNRSCVNPAHLQPVTGKENILRGIGTTAINSRKTHCKFGHPFDAENTEYFNGGRRCKKCHRRDSMMSKRRMKLQRA